MRNQALADPTRLAEPFWLRDWCIRASTHEISNGGTTRRLEPRTMAVLVCLAERAGHAVTREQLEAEVWQGLVVGYDSLSRCIANLRKALDDDASRPQFIETIPKVGYRLICEVVEVPPRHAVPERVAAEKGDRRTSSRRSPVTPTIRRAIAIAVPLALILAAAIWFSKWEQHSSVDASRDRIAETAPHKLSIAVLPFANLSDDPGQTYFSDGISDDLITDLSKIPGIFVIARNSSFAFRDKPKDVRSIARELGVRYILEGSVRRAENRIRINAQLIDATTGGHLWADRYDGSLSELFALQDRVTGSIVEALRIRLNSGENVTVAERYTTNIAAYDAFLRGWDRLSRKTPEDAVAAIDSFSHSLKLDPGYSRAYAALAQVYWDNAASLEFNILIDTLGADLIGGYIGETIAWNYLQKGLDRASSQAHALMAHMLQRQRRFDGAIEEARRAVAIGPSNPSAYDALIEILIYSNQVREALTLADSTIRLDPARPGEKLFLKGMAHYVAGNLSEALTFIERARAHNTGQYRYAAVQAASLAELGRIEEAKTILEHYRSGNVSYTTVAWTMLNWPFADPVVASRFADALVKAGLQTSSDRYYTVAATDRLTDSEIKPLVAGMTMLGIDRGPIGLEDTFEVTRDDNAQIIRQGFLTYFTDGESRIENDLLCDPWWDFGQYCVAVYRNPGGTSKNRDEFVFFTLTGVFTFSVSPPNELSPR